MAYSSIKIIITIVVITITIYIFSGVSFSRKCKVFGVNNKLILVQGRVLNAYYNGSYKVIKRADSFYGYGWIDTSRVFVAYQPKEEAEAFAKLELINIDSMNATKLTTIGGAGESYFDVNPETHEVVFNDSEGIKILSISNNSFRIRIVNSDAKSWGAFWVNSNTIGYLHYEKGNEKFVKVKVRS